MKSGMTSGEVWGGATITIKLHRNKHDDITAFSVKGYDDCGTKGSEVVSAVSVIAIVATAIIGLQAELGEYCQHIELDNFKLCKIMQHNNAAEIIISTMVAGLQAVEGQYPDYVRIEG